LLTILLTLEYIKLFQILGGHEHVIDASKCFIIFDVLLRFNTERVKGDRRRKSRPNFGLFKSTVKSREEIGAIYK